VVADGEVGRVEVVLGIEVESRLGPHHEVAILLHHDRVRAGPPTQGAPEIEIEAKPPAMRQPPSSEDMSSSVADTA
jgi:hypothetical protein